MRLLPYSKKLLAQRARGERPWLVLVTMGWGVELKVLGEAFGADVSRIVVPEDFPIDEADLSWAVGLDVAIVYFGDQHDARASELAHALWRARVATLWSSTGTPERDRFGQWGYNMSKVTLTRLAEFKSPHQGVSLVWGWPTLVKINGDLRKRVTQMREQALLVADAPLFSDPIFSPERSKLLAA